MKKKLRNNRFAAQGSRAQAEITVEAGRIMAEEGVRDYRQAKLKARDRLRLEKDVPLPRNQDVQLARDKHLTLFTPQEQIVAQRHKMMKLASEAMDFFQPFKPRLVADFLDHPVNADAEMELHLEAIGPEEIAQFLQQHYIPYEQREKQVHFGTNDTLSVPSFHFEDDEQTYMLLIFTTVQMRKPPRRSSNGDSQHRINRAQTEKWLCNSQNL